MPLAPFLSNEALPQFQIQGPQLNSDSGWKGWEGHGKWGHSAKTQVNGSGPWGGCFRLCWQLSQRGWEPGPFTTPKPYTQPSLHYHMGGSPMVSYPDYRSGPLWALVLLLLTLGFQARCYQNPLSNSWCPQCPQIAQQWCFPSVSEPFVMWSTLPKCMDSVHLPLNTLCPGQTCLSKNVQLHEPISEPIHPSPLAWLPSAHTESRTGPSSGPTHIASLLCKAFRGTSAHNDFPLILLLLHYFLHCIISTWWYAVFSSNYLYQVIYSLKISRENTHL